MQSEYLALEGPVERYDNSLVLRVPLDCGGRQLRRIARWSSCVEGSDVLVFLPEWVVESMRLTEGTPVHVDDRWGKLNIARLM